MARARIVGINHVALEVGDLDAALAFYGEIFSFELRGRVPGMAFLDMGDQFPALAEGKRQAADDDRHFGLVVDDREAVREAMDAAGVHPEGDLRLRDPWGNILEIVDYREVQFSKTDGVLAAMGLSLEKTEAAQREFNEKLGPRGTGS
jgi:catechol 2,3-dioxygenase-like lactoylglutathione lyase family enzyme